MDQLNQYVNHVTAAEMLGISKTTLYIWSSRKKINVFKLKGSRLNRYKISDLNDLMQPISD